MGVIWGVEAGGLRVGYRIVAVRRPKWGRTKGGGRETGDRRRERIEAPVG